MPATARECANLSTNTVDNSVDFNQAPLLLLRDFCVIVNMVKK